MNISLPFIRRPVATTLLMALLLLAGGIAYELLPVAALPEVDFPTIQVTAALPGASPDTMATSVATPLERQFSQIAGVSQMTSASALGLTVITVQFDLDRGIDGAAQDIQSAINAASGQLPKTLPNPPTYRKLNPADAPILVLGVHSDTLPATAVDDYADTILAQQISQVAGVAQVAIAGEQKPATRIQIDPAKIASLGISLEDIRAVIANATSNAPKGAIDGPARSFTLYADDQLTTAAPWNDVILAYKNGAPVRIRDVGRAVNGPQDTRVGAAMNGTPAIVLAIFKQPGANVVDTVRRVQAALPQLTAAMPPAIKVETMVDRTQTIRASVRDVQFTLVLTIGLVVMVIFLFLRALWATVIPSIAVPLSLVGTFGIMFLLGYSLDNLSLMALTISVGFVVDDAIVMLENIHRHIETGLSPMEAAVKGAGEIGFTILSISLSLVAVFIPLLLMGGIVGRLFREFAVTVTVAVLVSAAVSLTLTPMMCAHLLKRDAGGADGRFHRAIERLFDAMLAGYRRLLDLVLRHQAVTLAVFLAAIGATAWLFVAIPKGFFPQQDTGLIIGVSEAAQDVSFAEMARLQRSLADVIRRDPDVAGVTMATGATGGSQTLNNGRFWITLKPREERRSAADDIIRRLDRQLDAVQGIRLFMQAAQDLNVGGRVSRTQYQYTLQDPDAAELGAWAPKLLEKLKTLPQTKDVASDQQASAPTLTLAIDRDQAARFGIQPQLIDDTLYDAFGQRQVAQYYTDLGNYRAVLEVTPAQQGDPKAIEQLYIRSPLNGQQVPLSTLVKYTTRPVGPLSINHQGQFPAVTLSFNLAPDAALGDAVAAIQKAQAELGKPPALVGGFQGTAAAFQTSLVSQPYLIAAALIVVYIVLGMLYESFVHPLTIISTLPSAGLGALLALMLAGFDFSVVGLIGIVLLIGIVKKNGIMMVDFAIAAEAAGRSPLEAIREACLLRFRPIMMTTMAALLGGVPLMLGHGTGAEIRQPLGYAMVGGLLLSQALTLFTTPVIYLQLDRLAARRRRSRALGAPAALAKAAGPEGV